MSIVLASRLSSADMARLGNNVGSPRSRPPRRSAGRQDRLLLAAVNRSLAAAGERVTRLDCLPVRSAPTLSVA